MRPLPADKPAHVGRYPNSRDYVAVARRAVINYARTCGLGPQELNDLHFAVGEALANAVEHGYREGTSFAVRCWRDDEMVVVEVEDEGEGFDHQGVNAAEDDAPTRGFGITLMRALADEVVYGGDGRLVQLQKRVETASAPEATKQAAG